MRSVLTVVCVLMLSLIGQAQEVLGVSLDRRSREGTIVSGSFRVPTVTTGMALWLTTDIGQNDLGDVTKTAWVRVSKLVDGQWMQIAGSRWRGGNPSPGIIVLDMSVFAGQDVRFEIDTRAPLTIGASLEFRLAPPER